MPFPPPDYIACFPLQAYFVDKDTGEPLAGGSIYFYEDEARTTPKDVFIQSQQPDNTYTFTDIGAIVTLSSVGTTQYLGTDTIIFLYPYDASGDEQLYYIQVFSSAGVLQFTREAWPPNLNSGGGPLPSSSFISSENIISNPQFAKVNFPAAPAGAYTYTVAGPGTTKIAPDWVVDTPSAGTLIVTQVAVTDTLAPGLPSFALDISVSGFSGPVQLSQRILQSPRILENGYISGSFIAEAVGSTSTVTMNFVPSSGLSAPLRIASDTASLGGYTLINGTVLFPQSNINTNSPLTPGYVDVQVVIQNGAEVIISCVQVISVASLTTVPNYIQESVSRQVDHLYHVAYPIVPVGTIIDFAGFALPDHYLLCNGITKSRVTFQQLYRALTLLSTVTLTSSTSYTDTNAPLLYIGMAVEGVGIPTGTTISNISGTTITISHAATVSASSTLTYFAWGNGDGSTTFNIPDLRGQFTAGANNSLFATGQNGVGYDLGGASTVTLVSNNLPAHTHSPLNGTGFAVLNSVSGTFAGQSGSSLISNATTAANSTTNTAFSIIPPTTLVTKCIRYQ